MLHPVEGYIISNERNLNDNTDNSFVIVRHGTETVFSTRTVIWLCFYAGRSLLVPNTVIEFEQQWMPPPIHHSRLIPWPRGPSSISVLFLLCVVIESVPYNSLLSSTFTNTDQSFELSYLDGTRLFGNICNDVVSIGEFKCVTSFGCISPHHVNFLFSSEASGILGMGFASNDKGIASTNLFRAITSNASYPSSPPEKVFTLVIDKYLGGGVLQLGGYDLHNIGVDVNRAFDVYILNECDQSYVGTKSSMDCPFKHFRVAIDYLKLGGHVIYDSSTLDKKLTAVVDSGTTCLVLPSRAGTERVYTDVYKSFLQRLRSIGDLSTSKPSIYVGIGGSEVEILFDTYSLALNSESAEWLDHDVYHSYPVGSGNGTMSDNSVDDGRYYSRADAKSDAYASDSPHPVCVITVPDFPDLFILGDVFMQNSAIIHNMSDPQKPFITIIPRIGSTSRIRNSRLNELSHSETHGLALNRNSLSSTGPVVSLSLQRRNILKRNLIERFSREASMNNIIKNRSTTSDVMSSVRLEDMMGIEYVASIEVGTPPQRNISMIVDTGSGSMALITEGLPYDTSYKIPINRILVQTLYILLAIMSVVVGTYIYIKTFPRRKLDTAQPYSDLPFESEEHIECIELTEFPA